MTPYLGPIRFGDYSTVLKYFAIRSALADFGVYVIALRELGKSKAILEQPESTDEEKVVAQKNLENYYGKFVTSRFFMILVIYILALVIAYMLPAYTSNPYLVWGLPIGMLFSASFMAAGILQLPLQLFRKMEQVSIALVLARISQLAVLVTTIYVLYPGQDFDTFGQGIPAFMRIL